MHLQKKHCIKPSNLQKICPWFHCLGNYHFHDICTCILIIVLSDHAVHGTYSFLEEFCGSWTLNIYIAVRSYGSWINYIDVYRNDYIPSSLYINFNYENCYAASPSYSSSKIWFHFVICLQRRHNVQIGHNVVVPWVNERDPSVKWLILYWLPREARAAAISLRWACRHSSPSENGELG